ncbi:DUF551 domain-containing protein [Lactonifactor longoviformis]|uniref:DUF551 domain-containing protein n=1 Tax=Lactonifactor longoviformis DSM 17459 TaxID=1122155 RepID=A0A1M5D6R4_9CLOT|nr:DUF551 domain-containing protein [Lactonifactor longoviformis]POP32264.1 DUF551 domain-containing protein [Lactonifactor longoviformis]SHF62674.1 Protein of unknown function [Lactonifactor longoviformis DSM 17459]
MERLTQGTILFGDSEKQIYYKRLREYEATGLTPEEIMDGKMLTGWIPVEERLPKTKYPVLTTTWDGIVTIANWSGSKWRTYRWDEKVTAWMPLPEPYRPET